MAEIFVVWSDSPSKAQARVDQIVGDGNKEVIYHKRADFVQVEDCDNGSGFNSDSARYCIIVELR